MDGNLLSMALPKSRLLHKAAAVGLGIAILTLAVPMIDATAGMRLGAATVLAWLSLGWLSALIGSGNAVSAGLLPFIPAEVLKLALGTAILGAAWKQARR